MRVVLTAVMTLALFFGDALGGPLAHPATVRTLWDGGAIECYPRWFADGAC